MIIKALVIHAVMFLNAFPDPQGISKELSPCELVLLWQPSYSKHCGGQFGSFCQVCDKPTVTNLCTCVQKVSMTNYMDKIIEDFPEDIVGSSPLPHTENLFNVQDVAEHKLLPKSQAIQFHHTIAQLLFIATWTCCDIQTAVVFLTTRVKQPDEDDWGKVKQVLKYLARTRSLPLCLSVDNLTILKWYVDASHGVCKECKGKNGAGMTLGKGAAICFSQKQY